MSTWLIVAISVMAVGLIIGVIADYFYWRVELIECILYSFGACVVEAIVYGFYKLIPWVIGWDTSILTKVSFILIPTTLVLGVVFGIVGFALDDAERKIASRIFFTLMVLSLASFVASIFICLVAAWISSTAWRIGIWAPIGLVLVFFSVGFIYAIWTTTGNATGTSGTFYFSNHYDYVYDVSNSRDTERDGLLSDGYGSEQC